MVQGAVRVFPRLAGLEVIDEESARGEVGVSKFLELPSQVGDLTAIGTPAWFTAIRGNSGTAAAIAVHVMDVADLAITLAFVGHETDLRAVGRWFRIQFIDVRGAGQ